MEWVDLPVDSRPQLILAYEPSLDQAGHATGPGSALVNTTLKEVDRFAKDLHQSLADRNLSHIVDVIFVSDHGMADTAHIDWFYFEDIIGKTGCDSIEHEDGWPSMGLHFAENQASYLEQLKEAAAAHQDKFDVYTRESMPSRYHFSENHRIAPIYIVPKVGYALAQKRGEGNVYTRGNHGFDNDLPSMQAIFVADGPFVRHIKQKRSKGENGSTTGGNYVLDGFPNVEVKALVGRLLGVDLDPTTHNGTVGFWDKYL